MIPTIIAIGLSLMVLERIIPDQVLPKSDYWWLRVILINSLQLGVVLLAGISWELWFEQHSLLDLSFGLPVQAEAFFAYLIVTFEFYWWHRVRHDWMWAWDLFHQVHHSPVRIETITSFYKHPLEIACNSILISVTIFFLCGFKAEVAPWLTLYTAIGEFFYHMNIKTPYFLGFFFQRPEMHRIHHQRGRHYNNFSDLPIWDIMFGTFENPKSKIQNPKSKIHATSLWVSQSSGVK
ncbi:MAG: sterol desaturase family protein [Oligoflexales bacterium]|nr:sterol desaturase family protein [Oligoflexales bacterium]